MSDAEKEIRRALWLGHGHSASLYGDDGEMQCNSCEPEGDYKRGDLVDVAHAALRSVRSLRVAVEAAARCLKNRTATPDHVCILPDDASALADALSAVESES